MTLARETNFGHVGNFGHSIGNDVQYDVGYSTSFSSECPKLPTCLELPPFTLMYYSMLKASVRVTLRFLM